MTGVLAMTQVEPAMSRRFRSQLMHFRMVVQRIDDAKVPNDDQWRNVAQCMSLETWCLQPRRYFPVNRSPLCPAVDSLEACVFMLNYIGVHPFKA